MADIVPTLYFGDSMKIMAEMVKQGRTVDALCVDPPYKITSGGKNTGEMGGCFDKSVYNNSGNIVECNIDWPDFMPLFFATLRMDCHAYVMYNNQNIHAMLDAAKAAGFSFHNMLVWDKITATPNRWYMKNLEFCGFFYKGYSSNESVKKINDCRAKMLIRLQQNKQTDHPTEKPVPLMEGWIINSTQRGEVVFDPFMGTGATGVAAIRSGRGFIGIEQDERWFKCAEKRIFEASQQHVMF